MIGIARTFLTRWKARPLSVKMQQAPVCRSFAATGQCAYGARCRFVHSSLSISSADTSTSTGDLREYLHSCVGLPNNAAIGNHRGGYSQGERGGHRGGWNGGQGRGGAPRGERLLGPGHDIRRWLYNSRRQVQASQGSFLVVSYNILSSQLAADHVEELYWHVPPTVLAWENRRGAILEELAKVAPDIVGLQEVDRFDELQTELAGLGYEGTFKGRTGAEMTDGCATFWKAEEFTIEAVEELEFRDLNLRENVALLTVLKQQAASGAPARRLVVANTHILFNPKRGDIKLAQLRHLLEQAGELAKLYGGAPVVILGDFNASPESALYHFLSNGQLDLAATDRRNMSGQMEGHFHDGRPWHPYRPSTRIQVPQSPRTPEPRGLPMAGQAEASTTGNEVSPPPFKGLSSSLRGALGDEPGLESQRDRSEAGGPLDDLLASGQSDRDEMPGKGTGKEQASRRRRERSGEGAGEWESEWKRSREEEGDGSECVRTIGFSRGVEELSTSGGLEMPGVEGAGPSGGSPVLLDGSSFPPLDAPGGPTGRGSASSAVAASDVLGFRGGWQPQQRSNWGRRRPQGIDYVWDDEEFLIAVGGGSDSVVKHPLEGLRSAYATVRKARYRGEPACAREPSCTTYHGRARGTVDYIWFTPGLHPLRVLDTLPMQSVQRLRGLPTERWPSDHFCIACEFCFDVGSM